MTPSRPSVTIGTNILSTWNVLALRIASCELVQPLFLLRRETAVGFSLNWPIRAEGLRLDALERCVSRASVLECGSPLSLGYRER